MRRAIVLSLFLFLFGGCDSTDPDPEPTPLELLTAHRWYSHGYTAVDVETGEPYPDDEFLLPDWYEFDTDGIMRASQFGEISQTTYELSTNGTAFTAMGVTWDILELNESTLRFRYEAFDTEFTVTTHPTPPGR